MNTSSSNTRRKEQAAFWRLAIEKKKKSEMSVSQFCKAEGLPESSFYNWRKKLAGTFGCSQQGKRRQKNSQASPFVELTSYPRTGVATNARYCFGTEAGFACGTRDLRPEYFVYLFTAVIQRASKLTSPGCH